MSRLSIARRRPHNRGSVYVLVLSLGTLVSVMVIGVLLTNRLSARQTGMGSDRIQAETLAESAIDYALTTLNADATWRTDFTSGVETTPIAFNGGTISFKLVDEITGNLNSKTTNPVRLYGIGRFGTALRIYTVLAEGKTGLTCLNAAVMVGGNMTESDAFTINTTSDIVATNGTFTGNSSGGPSTVSGNLETVGTVTLNKTSVTGTTTTPAAARIMPAASVFEAYIAMGTPITYSSIPGGTIQRVLISPSANPYSSNLNTRGIYVIDCGGSNLIITDCRIVGTLVILNPGSGSSIGINNGSAGDQICWEPALVDYPCLLVNGNIGIGWSNSANAVLSELLDLTNYNPAGTPYPYASGGTSNILTTDTYPSVIAGLVYVSGNVTGGKYFANISEIIIGGTCDWVRTTVTTSYSNNYFAVPPPGFRGGGALIASPGTWKWSPGP